MIPVNACASPNGCQVKDKSRHYLLRVNHSAPPPFVIRYRKLTDHSLLSHQVLVSVSKRNFKRAVDRNRLKRQIREAYRLNKHLLTNLPDKYAIAYIYTFKKMIPYKDLENKLIESLSRLQTELSKINEN